MGSFVRVYTAVEKTKERLLQVLLDQTKAPRVERLLASHLRASEREMDPKQAQDRAAKMCSFVHAHPEAVSFGKVYDKVTRHPQCVVILRTDVGEVRLVGGTYEDERPYLFSKPAYDQAVAKAGQIDATRH